MKRAVVLTLLVSAGAFSVAVRAVQAPPGGQDQPKVTGGNEFFAPSVEIVAHENTKTNMQKMDAFSGEKAAFLPKKTFKDKLSLMRGTDQIDLYYFGRGHTNGDAWIVFPR